jgi:hypothetical protein
MSPHFCKKYSIKKSCKGFHYVRWEHAKEVVYILLLKIPYIMIFVTEVDFEN